MNRRNVRARLAATALLILAAGSAAAQSLTRADAVKHIATCEQAWYNQAYLCEVKSAKYESLDEIGNQVLLSQGFLLSVFARGMSLTESLVDADKRAHSISAFNGTDYYEWANWLNDAVTARGAGSAPEAEQNSPSRYLGSHRGIAAVQSPDGSPQLIWKEMPLSQLIQSATEFRWGQMTEQNGEKCITASCVFQSPDPTGSRAAIRYEFYLAAEGGLFPMRMDYWITEGGEEKRAESWYATAVEKDTQRRVWHLKRAIHLNLGPGIVESLDVMQRRPLAAEPITPALFSLQFPPDARVRSLDGTTTVNPPNHAKRVVMEMTCFNRFFTFSLQQAMQQLNSRYRDNWSPPWELEWEDQGSGSPGA